MNKLTAMAIAKTTKPGRYGDGGGLYFLVGAHGGRSWVFRFKIGKRERAMGLGPYPEVSLADARAKAAECRRLRIDSIDPLDLKNAEKEQRLLAERGQTTFKECAESYIALHEVTWKNSKHRQQWRNTLATYAYPVLGQQAVAKIDAAAVLSVLEPVWIVKPETASRLRGRIEAILDWAKVKKMREGDNPAAWKANLAHALPAKSKIKKVRHHAAMDYRAVPDFFQELVPGSTPTELALKFLVLTAARTGEVIGARWTEIGAGFEAWTVPPDRMKAGREHRVPLSEPARALLVQARQIAGNSPFLFPGRFQDQPLSNMAMLELLRRWGKSVTAHGFRSSFRDWAAEETNYPHDVVEMALAHVIENKVEAAYRRGDLFAKRRELMAAWARFICPQFKGLVSSVTAE